MEISPTWPKICSIIIVSFNSSAFISRCLSPLVGLLNKSEIIVVDNNSEDNTLSIVEKDFPSVKTVPQKENLGFGRAANRGVTEAKGEFVFLLNPDTVPSPSAIITICNFLKMNAPVGIAGARQIDTSGHHYQSTGDFPSLWRMLGDRPLNLLSKHIGPEGLLRTTIGAISSRYKVISQPESVSWVSGAVLCCRRSTWDQLGGFDENFFFIL